MKGLVFAFVFGASTLCVAADPHAVYFADSKSIIIDVPAKTTSAKDIYGALYKAVDDFDVLVQSFGRTSFVDMGTGQHSRFRIAVQELDPKTKYSLRLFEYPSASGTLFFDLAVERSLVASIRQGAQCPNGVEIRLSAPTSTPGESKDSIRNLYSWFPTINHSQPIAAGSLKKEEGRKESVTFSELSFAPAEESRAERDGTAILCLKSEESLPVDDGKLTIQVVQSPPDVLQGAINAKFKGEKALAFADSDKDVGKRALEKNLDAELTFASSVKTDDTTKVRSRSNEGVLDLRLAPWLNLLQVPATVGNTLRYFTPIYFDAKVSTGKISDDTLSANRVAIGSQYEWRIIPDTSRNTMHRLIAEIKHLSDRDFRQLEFDSSVSYSLMFDPLYQPLKWREKDDEKAWFGWTVTPTIEFEVGKTYKRRNPAPAVKPSDTVRRFGNGLDLRFDFTKYVVVIISDKYFVRSEAVDTDLFHNHFKAELQLPVAKPFRNSGQSLTISFERGNVPPFATPDVNAVKIGYQFSSTRWFGQSR
jgi:hypothetical protein